MTRRFPYDAAVAEAERQGQAPIDACPGSPLIVAVGALADTLIGQEVTM